MNGYDNDGLFRPERKISRSEAAKILVLSEFALTDIPDATPYFLDTPKISPVPWFYKFVALAVQKGYVNGYIDAAGNLTNIFGPLDNLKRAEAAKIITKIEHL